MPWEGSALVSSGGSDVAVSDDEVGVFVGDATSAARVVVGVTTTVEVVTATVAAVFCGAGSLCGVTSATTRKKRNTAPTMNGHLWRFLRDGGVGGRSKLNPDKSGGGYDMILRLSG
ncbi:hypothetical protein SAMN05445060_0508 [Williamsia sterculiae]|uniref:Uncharacterized protein n=1 Tax=Williamsia sterculiae TaxID=1344003 RepID=A0A1N7D1J6_9NOCA|nr:hypothetical protein SAMN05445060_0508 [Williamsia sterculiae]